MNKKYRLAAGLIFGSLALSACASSANSVSPDLESGDSGPSGEITLYTSEVQANIDELISAFNAEYPDIQVHVFRAGTGDLVARLESEILAQGQPQADVFLAADVPTFEDLKSRDLLLQWIPEASVDLLPDVVDPDGYYVGTRVTASVIAYNTEHISEPPTSWKDLTSPEYADKIAMPNPDVSGAAAYNAAVWLDNEQLGEAWLMDLAKNSPLILDANGPVSQAIASGSSPLGIVVDYMALSLAEDGSPVGVVYPSEGVPYVSQPAGIFKHTKNPEAAQALIDFFVSESGQKMSVSQNQIPVRKDVGTPPGAPSLDEILLMTPDSQEQITLMKKDAVNFFNQLFK